MTTLLRDLIYKLVNIFSNSEIAQVSVFCYHSINTDTYRYSVSQEDFEKHINYLLSVSTPIALKDLKSFLDGKVALPKKAFLLTFDDGYADILKVRDFLESKNIKPVLFTFPTTSDVNFKELGQEFKRISIDELNELKAAGWDIGCHTNSHDNLTKLAEKDLDSEIVLPKHKMEDELSATVDSFSYPKGKYNKLVERKVLESGFTTCFTMDDAIITSKTNALRIPRIGVDKTHTFEIFKILNTRKSIKFRKFIKDLGILGF